MPKFTIVALQGANGTKQSLKVPTAIQGAELKEEIWNVFGLSDDAADVEVHCITRGRPGTEIRIGPQDDLESLGITTGDILQVTKYIITCSASAGHEEIEKNVGFWGTWVHQVPVQIWGTWVHQVPEQIWGLKKFRN